MGRDPTHEEGSVAKCGCIRRVDADAARGDQGNIIVGTEPSSVVLINDLQDGPVSGSPTDWIVRDVSLIRS